MPSITAIILLVAIHAVLASQCHEFQTLNVTLPAEMANFCVGIFDNLLTILNNQNELQSYITPMHFSHFNWKYNFKIHPQFNATFIKTVQVCIQCNDFLYGISIYDKHLFIFNLQTNEYQATNTYNSILKTPANQSCLVIARNELYIIGGVSHPHNSNVQTYSFSTGTFSYKKPTNNRRKGHGCSSNYNSRNSSNADFIYIFSGKSSHTDWYYYNSIEKYDIANNAWETLRIKMIKARWLHTCSFVNDKIYCVGGWTDNVAEPYLNSVEIFDIKYNRLQVPKEIFLTIARYRHSAIVYKNYLLVLGGYTNAHQMTSSIEALLIEQSPTMSQTESPTFNIVKHVSVKYIWWIFGTLFLIFVVLLIMYFGYKKNKKLNCALLDMENVRKYNGIYHETQEWEFCLIHALNALFQQKRFTTSDMNGICKMLAPNKWINPHKSILQTGNYDANALMMALEKEGVAVQWFDSRKAEQEINLFNDNFLCPKEYNAFIGFILNNSYKKLYLFNRRHWLTIKIINNIWYNLDSKLAKPFKYETESQIQELQDWLINVCKNNDAQLMICRLKKQKK